MGTVTRLAFAALLLVTLTSPVCVMAQDYMLGEGDLLKINVYENDDLTTQTRVAAGGVISFPLAGQVMVSGLTVSEVEQKLTGLLSGRYIIDPHVTVLVLEYRSKKVTILGEVSKAGLYELTGNVSLIEIISRAGGLTDKAGDTLVIQRKKGLPQGGAGDATAGGGPGIVINLKDLMVKGDLSSNVIVQDGDSIFITRSGLVYVLGEVNKPGAYKLEEGTTVMKAVTLAGGFSPKASPGRTKLIRKVGDKETTQSVELDQLVEADDVINVPESYF